MPRSTAILIWVILTLGLTVASTLLPAANFARTLHSPTQTTHLDPASAPDWFTPPPANTPHPLHSSTLSAPGFSLEQRSCGSEFWVFPESPSTYYEQHHLSVGWPFPTLAAAYSGGNPLGKLLTTWQGSGIKLQLFERQLRIEYGLVGNALNGTVLLFPVSPYMPGLLANICIWACSIIALHAAARWARSRMRRGKGRCAFCNFEVLDLPRCPECGTIRRGGTQRPLPGNAT